MNSQTLSSRADLEIAEVALREVLAGIPGDAKGDAVSLRRMLVHLVGMHEALSCSPDGHANVAKRLGDFALTATKIAGREPMAAPKLMRLAGALRCAGDRLGERLRTTTPAAKDSDVHLPWAEGFLVDAEPEHHEQQRGVEQGDAQDHDGAWDARDRRVVEELAQGVNQP